MLFFAIICILTLYNCIAVFGYNLNYFIIYYEFFYIILAFGCFQDQHVLVREMNWIQQQMRL